MAFTHYCPAPGVAAGVQVRRGGEVRRAVADALGTLNSSVLNSSFPYETRAAYSILQRAHGGAQCFRLAIQPARDIGSGSNAHMCM